ncbi:Cold-shock DEAD-box protein A [Helicobacter ailurogastricus]|nr:Cold-shock DEAD-box protein A [Helicobacter ailurogastricus]
MQKDIGSSLELYEIPHMDEDRLVQALCKVEVDAEVVSLYEQLTEQFEPSQLVLKLLSLQFKSHKVDLNHIFNAQKPAGVKKLPRGARSHRSGHFKDSRRK